MAECAEKEGEGVGELSGVSGVSGAASDTSDTTPDSRVLSYMDSRLEAFKAAGINPYPEFGGTTYPVEFVLGMEAGLQTAIGGRIVSIRSSGKKLLFFDVGSVQTSIQVMMHRDRYPEPDAFDALVRLLHPNDHVYVEGTTFQPRHKPEEGKKAPAIAVLATTVTVVSVCLHPVPKVRKSGVICV
jgi:lysyl-tRNA synthetase class II